MTQAFEFEVNGKRVSVTPAIDDTPLLDVLRNTLGLMGTRFGCGLEQCGCCMVLIDGQPEKSCAKPVWSVAGKSVTTIEGLAPDAGMHPLQEAFVAHDGFQCGYCTPGQICSAVGMVQELRRGVPSHVTTDLRTPAIALTHDELRERMSGNLCRCGAYNGIAAAIAEEFERAPT